MAISNTWTNENTIYPSVYKSTRSSGIASFNEVRFCEDIDNCEYEIAYKTKKVLKGCELAFFKSLGEKCAKKEATSVAYALINNKVIRYYYKIKDAIKSGSLICDKKGVHLIVISIKDSLVECRNRNKDVLFVKESDVTILRY